MTTPEDNRDEPAQGTPEPDKPFDEDAAWRAIVANYGERPEMGEGSGSSAADVVAEPGPPAVPPVGPPAAPPVDRGLFDRSYLDAQEESAQEELAREADDRAGRSWSEEGHYVPPEPPPVPRTTPARRLAWAGLFGAPLLMLVAVVLGRSFPEWVSMLLVAGFVGGFVFLVATMERTGGDGSGSDDGAVV
jgi:hypothetical protein